MTEAAARQGLGARLAAASREDAVRERFLRAVFAEVPLARVAEVHLFAPLRQGGVETGVAVVAARPDAGADGGSERGAEPGANPGAEPGPDVTAEAAPELAADAPADVPADVPADAGPAPDAAAARHTVYTARYRLTVKGPDRGRWQVDVRAEADAPLLTVDAVVRGVQRRAGDATPPARLAPAECARAAGLPPDAVSGAGPPASAA